MYEGDYQNDKKNGMGIFVWESGNYYKGCYKDDERHGYGEMYWKDGSCYKGEWSHGIQHGVGKMEFPDGRVKEGIFENNNFKAPQLGTPQIKQLKAQEILVNNTLMTPPVGQRMRLKSRGGLKSRGSTQQPRLTTLPSQNSDPNAMIQLNNKLNRGPMSISPPHGAPGSILSSETRMNHHRTIENASQQQ